MATLPKRDQADGLSPTVKAILLMVLSTALLAAMHAMVRGLSEHMHPFEVVFFRNLFGLVAVLPLLARGGLAVMRTRQPKLQILRSLTGIGGMMTWFYALSVVPIATATALSFMAAIFASLGAVVFLGERMRLRRWSAVLVGLVGALLVVRPGLAGFNPWAFLVLASTVMWGTSIVIVKQLGRTDSTVCIVAWMGIMMTVLSLPPALLVWTPPSAEELLWLLLVGTLATLGHLSMTKALKLAEATAVMTVDYTRLIWASVIGYLAFGEIPDAWTWAGGSLIFASGLYIIFREARVKGGKQQGKL